MSEYSLAKPNPIGVIGCGTMGTGIAQIAATSGYEVRVYDSIPSAIESAQEQLQRFINKLAAKGKISNEAAVAAIGRIYFVDQLSSLAECELVIEAVVEKPNIKQSLFEQLESIVADQAIIASNTSSLSITSLAKSLQNSTRFLGMHFFNPAPLMPLVEIIPGINTQPEVIDHMKALCALWGKTPVVAKDTPGFIVNRVARPYYSEALRILEEGLASPEQIDQAMEDLGFKMGPCRLMDYIGHDVNFAVTSQMYEAHFHEPRYRPSLIQQSLVFAGYLGRKSGQGFYTYPLQTPDLESLTKSEKQMIQGRILYMLINEASEAFYHGVGSKMDIDQAMMKGANYPQGLFAWADDIGIKKIVKYLDKLFDHYHEPRYRVCALLRQMRESGQTFYP